MRYCVWGLGAIGGTLAYRLAASGADVMGVARGDTLDCVRQHGLRLQLDDGSWGTVDLPVSESPAACADADVVILALKSTALPSVAPVLAETCGSDTVVATAMNGLPWWFRHGVGDPAPAPDEPTELLRAAIPSHRVLGMAVHLTAVSPTPGALVPTSGRRLVIGPAGSGGPAEERGAAFTEDLEDAGFDVELTDDIRSAVWFKLLGNLALNPLSLITRSPVDQLLDDPLVHQMALTCMEEALAIGRLLGLDEPRSPADRLAATRTLGSFRTSMHQDAEAARPVELEALLGSVRSLGVEVGCATPALDALLGVSRLHARSHGLL